MRGGRGSGPTTKHIKSEYSCTTSTGHIKPEYDVTLGSHISRLLTLFFAHPINLENYCYYFGVFFTFQDQFTFSKDWSAVAQW